MSPIWPCVAPVSGIPAARRPEAPSLRPNPSIYQIDVRDRLYRCSQEFGEPCQLDEIPDLHLDRIASLGFDWIWLLGIWQTGPAGARVSRQTLNGKPASARLFRI